jgi:hypothetical protein
MTKDCEFCTPQAARACRDGWCREQGLGYPESALSAILPTSGPVAAPRATEAHSVDLGPSSDIFPNDRSPGGAG